MISQESLGGKMNQIWFGLIWINPKESKIQRNKKNKETKKTKKPTETMFSRLVWTCLDSSSPPIFFGGDYTLSSSSTRKGLCMDSKRPIWF